MGQINRNRKTARKTDRQTDKDRHRDRQTTETKRNTVQHYSETSITPTLNLVNLRLDCNFYPSSFAFQNLFGDMKDDDVDDSGIDDLMAPPPKWLGSRRNPLVAVRSKVEGRGSGSLRTMRRTSSQVSCLSLRGMGLRRSQSMRSQMRASSKVRGQMDCDAGVAEDLDDDDSMYETWIDLGDQVGLLSICLTV